MAKALEITVEPATRPEDIAAVQDMFREYAERYQDQIASGEDFFSLLGEYMDLGDQEWMGEYFQ